MRMTRRAEGRAGVCIALLTPASVSTDWFDEFVYGNALVLPIRPRLKFVGMDEYYPKDLMLSIFGLKPAGFEPWRWKR